jgi:hypothetical protein
LPVLIGDLFKEKVSGLSISFKFTEERVVSFITMNSNKVNQHILNGKDIYV